MPRKNRKAEQSAKPKKAREKGKAKEPLPSRVSRVRSSARGGRGR